MNRHTQARKNTNQISGNPEGPSETKDDDEEVHQKEEIWNMREQWTCKF